MIPTMFQPLANHLWQSTVFAVAAALLTLALRRNRAAARYWIWFAASAKFLLPFSVLVKLGQRFGWRTATAVAPAAVSNAIEQVSRRFAKPLPVAVLPHGHAAPAPALPALVIAIWATGFFVLMAVWLRRWWILRCCVSPAAPVKLPIAVEARTSPAFAEPGVYGFFRPILLLPAGILDRLAPPEWEAVLQHELCHIRRCDNLLGALQMLVERLFWFHPLVWWLGVRLVEERERACDEDVLRLGSRPEVYAEGILRVCELYLESPMPCVAGVGGGKLKPRITAILSHRAAGRLSTAKKTLLALAGAAALAGPVAIGIWNAPPIRAQATANGLQAPAFDSASVKVSKAMNHGSHVHQDGALLSMNNVTLKSCIQIAFSVNDDRIVGPAWLDSERYDIAAKAIADGERPQYTLRLQTLLKDRFHLAVHREMREAPLYELVVAKSGFKIQEDTKPPERSGTNSDQRGLVDFTGVSMAELVRWLSRQGEAMGRTVVDKTGLTGRYTFRLHWSPEEYAGPDGKVDEGAAIMAAMQEQLGLKLEARKGPAEFLVIDHADKVPVEN